MSNADIEYAKQESELLTNIEQAKLELEKYGNELAYSRYQDALNKYYQFAQFDYQKQRDNISDEQWNKNFEYQKTRDQIADDQWQKNYELSKLSTLNKSYNSTYGNFSNTSDGETLSEKGSAWYQKLKNIEQNSWNKMNNKDITNGVKQAVDNGYITERDAKIILTEYGIY